MMRFADALSGPFPVNPPGWLPTRLFRFSFPKQWNRVLVFAFVSGSPAAQGGDGGFGRLMRDREERIFPIEAGAEGLQGLWRNDKPGIEGGLRRRRRGIRAEQP